jgi:hypothetical protein
MVLSQNIWHKFSLPLQFEQVQDLYFQPERKPLDPHRDKQLHVANPYGTQLLKYMNLNY